MATILGVTKELRPLTRLLLQSVRGETTAPLDADVLDAGPDDVLVSARMHRVSPAVHRRVRDAEGTPPSWLGPLAAARCGQLLRHLRTSADLTAMGAALSAAGVEFVVAKGPVASDLIWPSPDMREYHDVDVFVRRTDFRRTLDALLASGCRLMDRNWPYIRRSGRAELELRAPGGTAVDLHWDIAVTPALRRAFRIDLPAMIDRSLEATLGTGVALRVFDPVDTAVHLVFHAAQGGANRLMWITDIHYAVARPGFRWDAFEGRVRQARMEVPTSLILDRVGRALGFVDPPPPSLIASGGMWLGATRRKDERTPFPGIAGDPHLGGRIFSSARRSVPATALNAVTGFLATKITERRVTTRGPDDHVLTQDVPDTASREAYFDYVGSSTR